MNMLDEQIAAIRGVLSKNQRFTAADLQILRENADAFNHLISKADDRRIEFEFIDAIRALDETSTKLINKTNRLTVAILAL